MKINISNLKDGEHSYEFEESPEEFDIESLDKDKKVKADVVLYKMANQFNLDIDVKAGFIFECDRCLENYKSDLESSFSLIYKYDFSGEGDSEEVKEDNLKFISPKTHTIDIKEDVRDYLMLSIPMRKVPEEVNGVCSYCNRKIDEMLGKSDAEQNNPIWDELKKLKK
ncbi:MAG: DUF177 domain-containing protein [Ignavibacteriae bacterium]|nr:DUF177 domain-containing protein [Ignavibacteriota bacterium]